MASDMGVIVFNAAGFVWWVLADYWKLYVWFAAPLALLLIFRFPSESAIRRRMWRLSLLPLTWFLTALWASFVEHVFPSTSGGGALSWKEWPVVGVLVISIWMSIDLIRRLEGARLIAILLSLVNIIVLLVLSLYAGMALTGTYF